MAKMPERARFQLPAIGTGVRAGEHEAPRVERHSGASKPIRVWFSADEQEQVANCALRFLA